MAWVLLVLAYGLIKGLREVLKKKALEHSTVIEVLFLYTFISFLFVLPEAGKAGVTDPTVLIYIALKSLAIFIAWMCGFYAIEHMPVSVYGILDLSRVLFSTLLGIVVLGEVMKVPDWIGFLLVITGLVLLKFVGFSKNTAAHEKVPPLYVVLALISCVLNAVSGLMDKLLMSDPNVNDSFLQFWYMLFLVIYYGLYIIIRRPKIRWIPALKNYRIWILAALFVLADKCLFIANGYPESEVTVMTLIKQSSCLITILGGKIFFKEKDIVRRLGCAAIILAGIACSVIF